MKKELSSKSLGISLAIISALSMLSLSIIGNIGICRGVVEIMRQWHVL